MTADELAALERRVQAITRPEPALLFIYMLQAMAGLLAFPVLALVLYFRYHTMWFRFDATGVAMGFGVFFRKEMQLTYSRMQDIHLSQNILERWLGVGTVTVQTAGSGAAGNLSIPGVRDFEAIRDYLYARMRGVRDEHALPPGEPAVDALLVEIRDALAEAATALKGR